MSDTSSIILNYDGKTYSDSSRKKILERQVDSLSLNEYLIQGSSKYTVYGEENEENDYSFYLSAINGLWLCPEFPLVLFIACIPCSNFLCLTSRSLAQAPDNWIIS